MRTTPQYPRATRKGEEFDPKAVPVFQGNQGRYYDPRYSARDDLMFMARGGTAEVPGLATGSENYDPGADTGGYYERFMGPGAGDPPTTATTTGAWGDPLGPNSVAVSPSDIASGKYQPGQWIDTPRGWKQVQDKSYVGPGKPNRSGTMEYWLGKGGGRKGGGMPGWFRPGVAAGEAPEQHYGDTGFPEWMSPHGLEFRPGDYGGGPMSDSGQYPPSDSGAVGSGNVSTENTFTSNGVEYAPTTNPSNPGYQVLSGPNEGQVVSQLPGGATPTGGGSSNNPLDYLNPFGNTTQGGSGTGVPTQKAVGTTVGTLSNFLLPGSGFITGPLARWATNLIQHGWSRDQVQQAVQQQQQQSGGGSGGGGFNLPKGLGGFGQPMGYFEPTGGYGQGDPGNYDPTGPMGPIGTAGIVNASSPAGGGSFFGGRSNLGMALPGSFYGLGGSGGNFGNQGLVGREQLMHAMKFGTAPAITPAYQGFASMLGYKPGSYGWTPSLLNSIGAQGLPNPGALNMGSTMGQIAGAGKPMTKVQ